MPHEAGAYRHVILAGFPPNQADSLRSTLEDTPVTMVESADACLAALEQRRTGAIVVGDAIDPISELLRTIRERDPRIQLIVHPTTGSRDLAEAVYAAGANAYVPPGPGSEFAIRAHIDTGTVLVPDSAPRDSTDIEALATPACYYDDSGCLLEANDALLDLYGAESESEVVGRPLLDFVHPDDHQQGLEEFDRVLDGETVGPTSYQLLAEDGVPVPVRIQSTPTRYDGEWAGRSIVDDLTPFRAIVDGLRAQHTLTQQSLDALNDFYAVLSPAGDLIRWNDRVNEVTGYTDDEIATMDVPEFLTPGNETYVAEVIQETLETGSSMAEVELLTKAGDVRVVEFNGARLEDENGRLLGLAAIGRDVTERNRLQRELEDKEKRYRRLVEMSPNPIVVHVDHEVVYANGAAATLLGAADPDELLGSCVFDFVAESDREASRSAVADVFEKGSTQGWRARAVETLDGSRRHVQILARAIPYDGDEAVLAVLQDRTDQRAYYEHLTNLHGLTREMMAADTAAGIAAVAVRAADEILGVDATAVYQFSEDQSELTPTWFSSGANEALIEGLQRPVTDGILWDAFASGSNRNWSPEDVDRCALTAAFPVGKAIPLGNHGVFAACVSSDTPLDDVQREFARLLAGNLEAAFDRLQRVTEVRARDAELAARNDALRRVGRLNTIARRTTQAIIRATTRPEVEENVCSELAAHDQYSFVWSTNQSPVQGELQPSTWSDIDPAYIDHLTESMNGPMSRLVRDAFDTGTVQVRSNVLTDPDWSDHRRDALTYGFRSIAAIPVPRGETVESVIVVHAADGDVFDTEERAVLAELGETVGYAYQSVDRRLGENATERTHLELAVTDDRFFANRIAAATGARVTYVGGVSDAASHLRLFLRVGVSYPDRVVAAVEDWETVIDVRPVGVTEAGALMQFTLSKPEFVSICEDADADLRSIDAMGGVATVSVSMPTGSQVRTFVEAVEALHGGTELTARRNRSSTPDTRETFSERLRTSLTARQLEALETANFGGFYEWPREVTTEELGGLLDIASSTYQYHLRAAERKLVDAILYPEDPID